MLMLAVPAAYLVAALAGSLFAVNGGWTEPAEGTTIYLVDNGIHTDIVMPAAADGLDWRPLFPGTAGTDLNWQWIAFGAGEQHVYLDTPTWWDITPRTLWFALRGGPRVMHVAYAAAPETFAQRQIRLRPEEYRRLWASIRAEFVLDARGRPQFVRSGYGCCDAFYRGIGKASAVRTCNNWVADRLRLAGVKASVWPPFGQGLAWRYRLTKP